MLGAVLFSETLFANQVLSSSDLLPDWLPWRGESCGRPRNPVLSDPVRQFVPWLHLAREEIRQGRLPLWNPYSYCGAPLAGNFQSAVFYPLSWIAFALPFERSFAWGALCRLLIAGLFTFLFLRARGRSPLAGAFGAVAFSFCGFIIVRIGFSSGTAVLWLPGLFLAADRCLERPGPGSACALAVLVAMPLLGGHPETAFFCAIATGAYFALGWIGAVRRGEFRRRDGPARLGWFAAGSLAGAALAAIQLLPGVEYMLQSHALARRSGMAIERGTMLGASLDAILGQPPPGLLRLGGALLLLVLRLLFPLAVGSPARPAGEFAILGGVCNYNECTGPGYVGLSTLLLSALGLRSAWRDRSGRALVFLLASALLLAYPIPGVQRLVAHVPLLRLAQTSRLLMVANLCLACLAAWGIDAVTAAQANGRGHLPRHLALFVAGVAACALAAAEVLPWFVNAPGHAAYLSTYLGRVVLVSPASSRELQMPSQPG